MAAEYALINMSIVSKFSFTDVIDDFAMGKKKTDCTAKCQPEFPAKK